MASTNKSQEAFQEEFADELKVGTELLRGQYTIEKFLANGGFGITYLAKDSLNRLVVIKECFPQTICRRTASRVLPRLRTQAETYRKIVELFVEEARKLARLRHPNIVGVHQVFEDFDTAYMALDYVDGQELLSVVDGGQTIEPEDLERMTLKLLDAVEFIHSEGILHRDISPDNILMTKSNEPVLIDFGAARETVTRASRFTGALQAVKDGYSPHEFYITDADQYPSSDLYSLGATLYHIITKTTPPNAQERMNALVCDEKDPYVPIANLADGYSKGFLRCIDKALEVLPKNRIQSAKEWRQELTGSTLSLVKGSSSNEENVVAVEAFAGREGQAEAAQYNTPNTILETSTPVKEASSGAATNRSNKLLVTVSSFALVAAMGAGFVFMSDSGSDDPVQQTNNQPVISAQVAPIAPTQPVISEPAAPIVPTQQVIAEQVAPTAPTQPVIAEQVAPIDPTELALPQETADSVVAEKAPTQKRPEVIGQLVADDTKVTSNALGEDAVAENSQISLSEAFASLAEATEQSPEKTTEAEASEVAPVVSAFEETEVQAPDFTEIPELNREPAGSQSEPEFESGAPIETAEAETLPELGSSVAPPETNVLELPDQSAATFDFAEFVKPTPRPDFLSSLPETAVLETETSSESDIAETVPELPDTIAETDFVADTIESDSEEISLEPADFATGQEVASDELVVEAEVTPPAPVESEVPEGVKLLSDASEQGPEAETVEPIEVVDNPIVDFGAIVTELAVEVPKSELIQFAAVEPAKLADAETELNATTQETLSELNTPSTAPDALEAILEPIKDAEEVVSEPIELAALEVTEEPLIDLEPQPAPEPAKTAVEEIEIISGVRTANVVEFPVLPNLSDPNVILFAGGAFGEQVEPGRRIVSVNEVEIESLKQVPQVIAETTSFAAGDLVKASFEFEEKGTGEPLFEDVTLPALKETSLPNGVRFHTQKQDGAWVTMVVDGSGIGRTDLLTGDQIVALMPSNEAIDTEDGMAAVLRREIEKGTTRFNFAVKRNDALWFVSMSYDVAKTQ